MMCAIPDRYTALSDDTLRTMLANVEQTLRRPSLPDARRIWAEAERKRIKAALAAKDGTP
jgi:hypothetical protein